jgi:protein-disulfide isomerase
MYEELFKNQKSLEDADLRKAAQTIGLDLKKYDECFAKPAKKFEIIDENFRSGEKLGVTGTPAFFINGRRLSGALPYEEFKRVIDSELAKK